MLQMPIGSMVIAKIGVTKAWRRDFELQSSDLWGNENDLSAQLQIQLIGFEPNLSHFSSLKPLHKKHVFELFGAYLEGDAVDSTKSCAHVSHSFLNPSRHPDPGKTIRFSNVLAL